MWGAIFLKAYLAAMREGGARRERLLEIAAYARAKYLNACRMAGLQARS